MKTENEASAQYCYNIYKQSGTKMKQKSADNAGSKRSCGCNSVKYLVYLVSCMVISGSKLVHHGEVVFALELGLQVGDLGLEVLHLSTELR